MGTTSTYSKHGKQAIITLVIICLLMVAGLYFLNRKDVKNLKKEKYEFLSTVAEMKISQLNYYLSEKLGDANVIIESPFLRNEFSKWLKNKPDTILLEEIKNRLFSLQLNFNYEDILVVDKNGEILISLIDPNYIDPVIIPYIKIVAERDTVINTNLYECIAHSKVHYDIIAPLKGLRNETMAIIVMRIDPDTFIFPLLLYWPTPSKSAETYLVQKKGNSVLFVNPLRHIKAGTQNFSLPLSTLNLSASKAVSGHKGLFEGVDYRGVKVLSDIRPVPNTSWFMINEIDQDEVFEEVKYRMITSLMLILLIIIVVGFGFMWHYNYKERNLFEKLFTTEKKLNNIIQSTPSGVHLYRLESDNRLVFEGANKSADKILGVDHSIFIGKTIEEAFPQLIQTEIPDAYRRVAREAIPWTTESVEYDENRIKGAFEVHAFQVSANHMAAQFQEITERKKIEEALVESEEKFRLAFMTSPESISINRLSDGVFMTINEGFQRLTGYSEDDVIGKSSLEINLWEESYRNIFTQRLQNYGYIENFEIKCKAKNGEIRSGLMSARIINTQDDPHVIVITRDITELKKVMEELNLLNAELEQRVQERTSQLREVNQELEAFAYSISHDLRAPLRAIDGFTHIFMDDNSSKLDNEAKRICSIIIENTAHMGHLIDDLLAFSKISRSEMSLSEINMGQIVDAVFNNLVTSGQHKQVKTSIQKLGNAIGDDSMIRQVWTNLISNALKFTSKKEDPEIAISFEAGKDEVIYSISDNGAGFDKKYINKIFGVFQRLHSQDEFEGTGVGLAIVQRIIVRHGGRVWAEGEPGKGAIFYFSLPVSKKS